MTAGSPCQNHVGLDGAARSAKLHSLQTKNPSLSFLSQRYQSAISSLVSETEMGEGGCPSYRGRRLSGFIPGHCITTQRYQDGHFDSACYFMFFFPFFSFLIRGFEPCGLWGSIWLKSSTVQSWRQQEWWTWAISVRKQFNRKWTFHTTQSTWMTTKERHCFVWRLVALYSLL